MLISGLASVGSENRAIWVISTVTGTLRLLREGVWRAAISPDSSRIAFITHSRDQIWLMGANGEEPRKILAAAEGRLFEQLAWSPTGQRLAFMTTSVGFDQVAIESINPGEGNPVTLLSDQRLNDFCWAPNGRVIYSLAEPPPNEYDSNLWEIHADPRTGKASGKPRRITNWAGFGLRDLTFSADGKRLALISLRDQSDVYVGELKAKGAQLANVRRLTFDERIDWPGGWTGDGKVLFYSDRNGQLDIFRQGVNEKTGEAVVTGPEEKRMPQPSPDGAWVLYLAWPKSGCCVSAPSGRLMRAPVSGGQPEPVFEVKGYPGSAQVARWRDVISARGHPDFRCPATTAAPCVVSELARDELVFTAFDPLRGRAREISRFRVDHYGASWDLSPDGSRIAFAQQEAGRAVIKIAPVAGGTQREIPLKGWSRLWSVAWSADGASLFASIQTTRRSWLLHVTMNGEVRVLRQMTGSIERPMASPDGRYLGFGERLATANAWIIENF